MTRPNELQQLDEDLAAGRLSPEDHRRRRDELLRDAAGASQEASPFPPAFRWETSPPEATTQVMQAVPPNPSYPASPSYQQNSGQVRGLFEPIENRSVDNATVDNPPVDNPSVGNPSVGNPSVGNPSVDHSAPPWANSDLPPIADQQNAWIRQGPEVFETSALQNRSKQIIGIAVLAVLVVGLVGAGVAYVLSAGPQQDLASAQPAPFQPAPSEPTTAARQLPAPPAPKAAPVDTPQALISPPGEARGGGGLLDLPRLESTNLLPRPILNALRAGAMTDGVLKTTTDDGNTIGMFAFTLADEQAATDVVNTIITVQRDGGLKIDESRAQQGLAVLGSAPGTPSTVYRGVYVLYNRAIFLEVFGSDYDAVLSTFDSIVTQQLIYAPPTVRGR
ncbi:MAG: hypothetical protein ACRDSG_17515 [Pseudonocardiaceae bacterium]